MDEKHIIMAALLSYVIACTMAPLIYFLWKDWKAQKQKALKKARKKAKHSKELAVN